MRPLLVIMALALTGLVTVGCTKTPQSDASAKTQNPTNSVTEPVAAKADADPLKALTAEQQVAVRALIRDTLITNPEILLEAQRAFEAKQMRVQNEKVAQSFAALKRDHAELAFGPPNAKITMIEFFDYRCAFCHAANDWVWNVMETRKDVRVIFKELPILSENSHLAAKAAIAAHKQGKYREFHRALMTARGDLAQEQVLQIAESVGLDTTKLLRDMADPKVEAQVAGVRQQATELGINGTPGFVINGRLVTGFAKDQLDAALASAGIDTPTKAVGGSSKG